jgi:hypothetical protein
MRAVVGIHGGCVTLQRACCDHACCGFSTSVDFRAFWGALRYAAAARHACRQPCRQGVVAANKQQHGSLSDACKWWRMCQVGGVHYVRHQLRTRGVLSWLGSTELARTRGVLSWLSVEQRSLQHGAAEFDDSVGRFKGDEARSMHSSNSSSSCIIFRCMLSATQDCRLMQTRGRLPCRRAAMACMHVRVMVWARRAHASVQLMPDKERPSQRTATAQCGRLTGHSFKMCSEARMKQFACTGARFGAPSRISMRPALRRCCVQQKKKRNKGHKARSKQTKEPICTTRGCAECCARGCGVLTLFERCR